MDEGYAATQILSQLHESVIERDLGDRHKSAIAEKMAVSGRGSWMHVIKERASLILNCARACVCVSRSGCEQVSVGWS